MLIKIASKRQVTFPARVLDVMGVGPDDRTEPSEGPGSYLLRPKHIGYSRLGTLREQIQDESPCVRHPDIP